LRLHSAPAGSGANGTRSTEGFSSTGYLASLDFNLSVEQVGALDEDSTIEPGFPYYLYNATMTRALAYSGMRDSVIA
jgi:hypothetical protein